MNTSNTIQGSTPLVIQSVADKTTSQESQGDDAHELDTADEVIVDATEEQEASSEQVEENDLIPT